MYYVLAYPYHGDNINGILLIAIGLFLVVYGK